MTSTEATRVKPKSMRTREIRSAAKFLSGSPDGWDSELKNLFGVSSSSMDPDTFEVTRLARVLARPESLDRMTSPMQTWMRYVVMV